MPRPIVWREGEDIAGILKSWFLDNLVAPVEGEVGHGRVYTDFRLLPPDVEDGEAGYIYVVLFSPALIKVGKTCKPRQRMMRHADAGRGFGFSIQRMWFSPAHYNYNDNENRLIRIAETQAQECRGNEYFVGADFADMVRHASQFTFPSEAEYLTGKSLSEP